MISYRRYWKKYPPTHVLAAAFMGYETPKQASFEQFAGALGLQVPNG